MINIHLAAVQEKKGLFFAKKYHYIALGVLLGLFLFYLVRSYCLNGCVIDTYMIGQSTNWGKLHVIGKERNLGAFNHELLVAIAKEEHFHVHILFSSNPMEELEEGELQGILTTLEPSYLNQDHLLFSEPYFRTGPVLIISSAAPVEGWNEQAKKVIGIPSGSSMLLGLEQDPSIQIKMYEDILLALTDLRERRIDGAIFPVIPAYVYTQTFYKHELKIATAPLNDEGIRLVTLKNEKGEALMKNFQAGLTILKENGTYDKMLERWGLMDVEKIISNSQ